MNLNKKISTEVSWAALIVGLAAVGVVFYILNTSAYEYTLEYERKDITVKNVAPQDAAVATTTATSAAALHEAPYLNIKGEFFKAIVARTVAEREQGLSGKVGLGARQAMFFVFDNDDRHGFWMKDMLFSIDIVWLDAEYKVVHIQNNATPGSYPNVFFPDKPARYVVELNSGTALNLSLKEGDQVKVSL